MKKTSCLVCSHVVLGAVIVWTVVIGRAHEITRMRSSVYCQSTDSNSIYSHMRVSPSQLDPLPTVLASVVTLRHLLDVLGTFLLCCHCNAIANWAGVCHAIRESDALRVCSVPVWPPEWSCTRWVGRLSFQEDPVWRFELLRLPVRIYVGFSPVRVFEWDLFRSSRVSWWMVNLISATLCPSVP